MEPDADEQHCANWLAGVVFEQPIRIDALLVEAVGALQAQGLTVAGVTQTYSDTAGCSGSEFRLQSIDGALDMAIMEPRGRDTRGCRLDYQALTEASSWIANALDEAADVFVLNRFGRSESEGNGLRSILQRCAEEERPTLIAVRQDYLAAWNEFHGGLGDVLPPRLDAILDWYRRLPVKQGREDDIGRTHRDENPA